MTDYVEELKTEAESKNYNRYRMYNEPSQFFDRLWGDLDIWIQTDAELFIQKFTTKTRWRSELALRSQRHEWIKGIPIILQFTLVNGTDLEVAARRINPS